MLNGIHENLMINDNHKKIMIKGKTYETHIYHYWINKFKMIRQIFIFTIIFRNINNLQIFL